MNSFNEAWSLICDFCKTRITDVAYKTWISRIEPVKLDFEKGEAILMVPNEFHMGYQSVKELATKLEYHTAEMRNVTTGYLMVDREHLYDAENQKILFPIVQ